MVREWFGRNLGGQQAGGRGGSDTSLKLREDGNTPCVTASSIRICIAYVSSTCSYASHVPLISSLHLAFFVNVSLVRPQN